MKKVALIVDGMNVLYRGHFAVGQLTDSDGRPTGAVKGLINILLADIKTVKATHVAVVFDRPGENFRHRLYPAYKANRPEDEGPGMRTIVPMAKEFLNAMGIKVFGKFGIEGDDTIGSLAVQSANAGAMTYIGSNDKDFASLVTKRLHLLKPKGIILDAAGVEEAYGVPPSQMLEYLMMLGDKVDNIPGINKVGAVTASKWLKQYGSLKAICAKHKFTPAMQKNIDAAKPLFNLTRKLITIDTRVVENFSLDKLRLRGVQPGFAALCDEHDFKSTKAAVRNVLGN